MGRVGQTREQATNIARGAVPDWRLPEQVLGVSVDRQCGSSQQAPPFAAGMESMSPVPTSFSSDFLAKAG